MAPIRAVSKRLLPPTALTSSPALILLHPLLTPLGFPSLLTVYTCSSLGLECSWPLLHLLFQYFVMYPLLQEAFFGFYLLQARWLPPWSTPSSPLPSLQPRPHWHPLRLLWTLQSEGRVCSRSILSTSHCISQTSAECWSDNSISFSDNQSHVGCFQIILLGPPAPQPEILGAQLWPNGLGWSWCSRGLWMGVGAWLEVLGRLARPRVGHGRGLREDWGAARKQGPL